MNEDIKLVIISLKKRSFLLIMGDLSDIVISCAIAGVGLLFVTNLVLVIVIGIYVNRGTGYVDADDMAKYMPIEISRVRASQQEVTSTLARGWMM